MPEIELTLGDGTVVKGTDYEEAFKNLAKITEDKSNFINTLKNDKSTLEQERNQYAQKVSELSTPPPKPVKEGEFDNQQYFKLLNEDPRAAQRYWFEHETGMSLQEVTNNFQNMQTQISDFNQRVVAADFVAAHPDFPQTGEAAAALRTKVQELTAEGHPFNTRTLSLAYDELVSLQKIKPVEQKSEPEEKPNPALRGARQEENFTDAEQWDDKRLEAELRKRGALA